MNILFLSKEYPPETGWGGIGTYVYNIAHALSERGHTIYIISLSYKSSPEYKEQRIGKGSIHIHRIRPVRFPTPVLNRLFFKSLEIIKFNIAVILKIRELLKTESFDIIESPEWRSEAFLLSFLKLRGIPLVIKCHSPSILLNEIYNPPSPPLTTSPSPPSKGGDKGEVKGGMGGLDSRFVDWMERTAARNADLVASPSKNLAGIISEKMGIKREGIRIIPNPLDTETFSPIPLNKGGEVVISLAPCPPCLLPAGAGLPLAPFKVLFVGRLDRLKGAHIFAEAIPIILRDVHDASFVMVGRDTNTGPDNSSMESYIKNIIPQEIQNRVIFTGNVERTALVDYYRESDVCVVPSFYENFPNTVLEAMSCGKAVVASNTGGIPEVIEDGVSGLLAKTGDARDFAEKIIGLLEDDTLRENMGANARKRIEERYAKNVVAREVENVYRELIYDKSRISS
ncbi:MAG: glycosyltransferase family 4 protein [Nitrospinae bacterium]|nr:glycosyltransferase family 4 protein [Nitrospinota bacterium]